MSLLPQPVVISDALVLRTWPTGETSLVASLLTAEHGYVRVIAKSARRSQSRLRPLVQPGHLSSLEFSLIPGRSLQYLRGGALVLDPLARTASLEKNAFLMAVLEMVDRCRPSGLDESRLFELCRDYVQMLSSSPLGSDAYLYYAFELALLALQGVAPALSLCSGCGKTVDGEVGPGLRFSAASGGVICQPCTQRERVGGSRALPVEVWAALCELASGPLATTSQVTAPRWVTRELGILLHHFLGYHLPGYRLPAALDLLRSPESATGQGRGVGPAGEEQSS